MADPKQGTTTGLPFATADGKPKGQASDGRAAGGRGERGRDLVAEGNRPQAAPPAKMPEPVYQGNPHLVSRPQTPGDVRQRVAVRSIPPDGATHGPPVNAVPPYRRETSGSVGATRMPFTLGDGSSARPSSAGSASASAALPSPSSASSASTPRGAEVLASKMHRGSLPANRK